MSHRYDDDPMTFVPYHRGGVSMPVTYFLTMCLLAMLGVIAIVTVLLVS